MGRCWIERSKLYGRGRKCTMAIRRINRFAELAYIELYKLHCTFIFVLKRYFVSNPNVYLERAVYDKISPLLYWILYKCWRSIYTLTGSTSLRQTQVQEKLKSPLLNSLRSLERCTETSIIRISVSWKT